MSQPAQNLPPMTLGDINERLKNHGLPVIAQNQIEAIQQIASREDIINAVLDLDFTPEAKAYLEQCFKQAGIFHPRTTYRGTAHGAAQEGSSTSPQGNGVHTMPHGSGGPRRPVQNNQPPGARKEQPSATDAPRPPASNQSQTPQQNAAHQQTPGQVGDQRGRASGNTVPIDERMSTHVYARNKAALCFEADISKNGFKTIALDGAKAAGHNFDWGNKIRIQMTKGEMPAVMAVLAGYSQFCEFKNHGPANNKGFSMERQGEKVYVKMFEKGKPMVGVPIHPQDLFYVYSLVMKRVMDESPWLDPMSVLQMVRATQPNMTAPPSENPPRRNVGGY